MHGDFNGVRQARHLPGVGMAEPGVGGFDLIPILELLAKDAIVVAQPIAHGRDLHRGHGIQEAGGETAQPAIAQPGIRLLLRQLHQVQPLALEHLTRDRLDQEIGQVVGQRATDQELHR